MAVKGEKYHLINVESYLPKSTSGIHGKVHIKPIPGQAYFDVSLLDQCSKELSNEYPVVTRFLIKGKLNDLEGEGKFIYSSYHWTYEVISIWEGLVIRD